MSKRSASQITSSAKSQSGAVDNTVANKRPRLEAHVARMSSGAERREARTAIEDTLHAFSIEYLRQFALDLCIAMPEAVEELEARLPLIKFRREEDMTKQSTDEEQKEAKARTTQLEAEQKAIDKARANLSWAPLYRPARIRLDNLRPS